MPSQAPGPRRPGLTYSRRAQRTGERAGPTIEGVSMTERLYQRDSYLKVFDGRVTDVRPDGVVLDRTGFFPTGGGVLGDVGSLTGPGDQVYRVADTVDDEH